MVVIDDRVEYLLGKHHVEGMLSDDEIRELYTAFDKIIPDVHDIPIDTLIESLTIICGIKVLLKTGIARD